MTCIHHYPLPVEQGDFTLRLPKGSKYLHVGNRQDRPTLWILVGDGPEADFKFYNAYTGDNRSFLKSMKHLGTLASWNLVFHYFAVDYD